GAFAVFAVTPRQKPSIAPAVAAPIALAPAAPPRERLVLLSVDPVDAHVTRDGKDLGPMPIAIRLKEGERAQLVIEKPGFATLTEVIDASALEGDETRRVVKL